MSSKLNMNWMRASRFGVRALSIAASLSVVTHGFAAVAEAGTNVFSERVQTALASMYSRMTPIR